MLKAILKIPGRGIDFASSTSSTDVRIDNHFNTFDINQPASVSSTLRPDVELAESSEKPVIPGFVEHVEVASNPPAGTRINGHAAGGDSEIIEGRI
jgi:hypothetical protein